MDHTVRCWDLNSGTCARVLTKNQGAHQDPVTCISTFSSDGPEYVISGGMDKRITIYNSSTGEVMCSDVNPDIVTAVKAVRDIESEFSLICVSA
jgi:WD40 repeat protein